MTAPKLKPARTEPIHGEKEEIRAIAARLELVLEAIETGRANVAANRLRRMLVLLPRPYLRHKLAANSDT